MTQTIDPKPAETTGETDLVAEVRRVLGGSEEPLTLSKIRSLLPSALRGITLDDLAESLRRQEAANVVIQYPKYRSQQDRFWDRPMPVHVASLLRSILQEEPLAWSELRRKLPSYVPAALAEQVLQEQLAQGLLYRLPRAASRGKERLSATPPDPREYLRGELQTLFNRLGQLGFSHAQLRAGALELLHEEEWATPSSAGQPPAASESETSSTQAGQPAPPTAHADPLTVSPQTPPPAPGIPGNQP